jgi:hypothetical protein
VTGSNYRWSCGFFLQSHQPENENAVDPDAERHTHKATTWELRALWAKVGNERLENTGDEARAIREANAVVARQAERG